ncbi:hypothetical protein [Glaciimonas sp. PCH181]|uniref:hypothetical protein n=1 Tax=Glaciimonas sp. PCH181 TaxID=2133943 RepID=UPI0011B21648|nr:hypothetical protein [Glaciimonas sp. PCH181]
MGASSSLMLVWFGYLVIETVNAPLMQAGGGAACINGALTVSTTSEPNFIPNSHSLSLSLNNPSSKKIPNIPQEFQADSAAYLHPRWYDDDL